MKRRWLVLSVLVLSLVIALPASTQQKSVLTNGGFESDVTGWEEEAGTLAYTTQDPYSGAGAAQVTFDAGDGYAWVYQCIDLTGELGDWPISPEDGKQYMTFNGYIKSDGTAEVALDLQFYTGTDCDGDDVGEPATSGFTSANNWTLLSATAEIPETPPGSVMASFWSPDTSGEFYADDLAVYSSYGVNAVQMQGLIARSGLWGIGLVGVLAAGVVLARRRRGS